VWGLGAGAAGVGFMGTCMGLLRAPGAAATRAARAVVGSTLAAVLTSIPVAYVAATTGAVACHATASLLGADPEAYARKGWAAGALLGSAIGTVVGAGGVLHAA
jgi:hypothetical protein